MNKQIELILMKTIQDTGINDIYEKFAELIVKECINVCRSRVGNSDYNTGRLHCVSDLKEHFGVKE
jgi:hypothetical protein